MTQAELFQHLDSLGIPLSYSHFIEYQKPPYMVYFFIEDDDLIADDINYVSVSNFDIELYTDRKDLASEKLIEDKLKELYLPYDKSENWIQSEGVFRILYEITVI